MIRLVSSLALVLPVILFAPARAAPNQPTAAAPRSLPDLLRTESSLLDALDNAVFEARHAEATARAAENERHAAETRQIAAEADLRKALLLEVEARARLASTLRMLRVTEPFNSGAVQVLLGEDQRFTRHSALLSRLGDRQTVEIATIASAVAAAEVAGFRAGIEKASAMALVRAGMDAQVRLDEEIAMHKSLLEAMDKDRTLQSRRAAEFGETIRELSRTINERRRTQPGPVDFDRLVGRVRPPLAGARVTVPFGDVIHPLFKTRTPHPGLTLEFPAPQARNVRSAAFGRVAWVGRMRGLGFTVLIDHASGWFSVYGGLSEVEPVEGAIVREGDVLGRVAPAPGERSARLYFELRKNAAAIDPRPYLAK
jgi:murein DD-endopeptidase MepM/ murein hydrolase activator NlpD